MKLFSSRVYCVCKMHPNILQPLSLSHWFTGKACHVIKGIEKPSKHVTV